MASYQSYTEALKESAIQRVVADLIKEKQKNNNTNKKAQGDSYALKLASLAKMGIVLTYPALRMRVLRKFQQTQSQMDGKVINVDQTTDDVSGLTTVAEESLDVAPAVTIQGRPKGTTHEKKREDAKNVANCIHSISIEYAKERARMKELNKNVKRGFLVQLIANKKGEFCVSREISSHTIYTRIKNGNLHPPHRGTISPLHDAEMLLVQICIQMGKIRQPLTGPQAIVLMNSLIKGTPIQESLKEYQSSHSPWTNTLGTVGRNWWYAFLKRHNHLIVTKRGEKFASIRADWTKKHNLAQMYDVVYDVMVEAHIASKRQEPVYTDRSGNEVEKSHRFGQKQDIKIDHPDYLIFADESGCQTNQEQDGSVGKTTHIVARGDVSQIMCSINDHQFTILPFTSASGHAVCCVLIFTSQSGGDVPIT